MYEDMRAYAQQALDSISIPREHLKDRADGFECEGQMLVWRADQQDWACFEAVDPDGCLDCEDDPIGFPTLAGVFALHVASGRISRAMSTA